MSGIYDSLLGDVMEGKIDLAKDKLAAVLTLGYKPDFAKHTTIDDVTHKKGDAQQLTGKHVERSGKVNVLRADNLLWEEPGLKADGLAIYKPSGPLVCFRDLGRVYEDQGRGLEVDLSEGVLALGSGK